MLQGLNDYAKCVIKNKFVIGGYLGIGVSLLMPYIGKKLGVDLHCLQLITLGLSSGSLLFTKCGKDTLKTYKLVRWHIEENKTITPELMNRFSKDDYCMQVAIELAAKEKGLEHLLKEEFK